MERFFNVISVTFEMSNIDKINYFFSLELLSVTAAELLNDLQ